MNLARFPYEFAQRAASILGLKIEATVTVRQLGSAATAGSSTDAAARCDTAQALGDDGPCIDAMDELAVHVVPALLAETRWTRWREQAIREGFASAIAVPAAVDARVAVTLTLYSRPTEPWTLERVAAAQSYAQLIAAMLAWQREAAELQESAAGLYRNMSEAVVVERAVGAIMRANKCVHDEARRALDRAAIRRHVSRREIGEAILRALAPPEHLDDILGG